MQRSKSVPGTALRRSLTDEETPRASKFPSELTRKLSSPTLLSAASMPDNQKRPSETLLRELSPLIIPKADALDQIVLPQSAHAMDDVPPKVPPKSPRIENTASPVEKRSSHSASSSVSTVNSMTSTPTSAYALALPSSRYQRERSHGDNSFSQQGFIIAIDHAGARTPVVTSKSRGHSPTMNQGKDHLRSKVPARNPLAREDNRLGPQSSNSQFKNSNIAISNRSSYKRGLWSPSAIQASSDIPNGFRASEVDSKVPSEELKQLKDLADEQTSQFEVLQMKDVSALSIVGLIQNMLSGWANLVQELCLLDERT